MYLSEDIKIRLLDSGFPKEKLVLGVSEEILRELPSWIIQNGRSSFLRIVTEREGYKIVGWKLIYEPSDDPEKAIWKDSDTLADAASEIWIYLKENNLLDRKED